MADLSLLHDFADDTKTNCFVTSLALFIIVVVMVAPTGITGISAGLAKLIAIMLLGYVFVVHSRGTLSLFLNDPGLLLDGTFRTNAILSCVFPLALFIIIGYVLFTFVF
tara:strand:- start:260 stop:586 length:327 start_codon:yes stop_codon:yes gene_type:complete